MIKALKQTLAKLKIAQLNNAKTVKVVAKKENIQLLNFLWRQGYIYGYKTLNTFTCKVFLKYSFNENALLSKCVLLNKIVNNQEIKNLNKLEKNCNYFILNDKGIFSQQECIDNNLGGILFAHI